MENTGKDQTRKEKPETMKKAPKTGALEWNLFVTLLEGEPYYLLFLVPAFFFFGAAFLVALFIDLFSLTSNFATQKNRNVIHI